MWRINNQFNLSYEFSESGDSMYTDCHEAMSDRQRHGQTISVLEDNAVRKVIVIRQLHRPLILAPGSGSS